MKIPNLTFIEPCEAGRFSAFVSENLHVYPCSFMTQYSKGVSLKDNSLINIWQDSSIFINIRKKLSSNRCPQCVVFYNIVFYYSTIKIFNHNCLIIICSIIVHIGLENFLLIFSFFAMMKIHFLPLLK